MKEKLPHSTASLVLGIFSIITCCFNGIPGVILGVIGLMQAKKAIAIHNEDTELYEGIGNANAGKVISIIGLIFSVIALGLWIYMSMHPEIQEEMMEKLLEMQQNQ